MMIAGSVTTRGGMDNARELLVSSVGERRASEILDRVAEHMVDLPFSFLQHADPRQILSYIGEEHPQTIALVLAHVPAALASQVLAGLAGDQRADVAHRIAVMDRTSPEIIRQVEASLRRRLSTPDRAERAVGGRRRPAAGRHHQPGRPRHREDDPGRTRTARPGAGRADPRPDVHVRGPDQPRRPGGAAGRPPGRGQRAGDRAQGRLGRRSATRSSATCPSGPRPTCSTRSRCWARSGSTSWRPRRPPSSERSALSRQAGQIMIRRGDEDEFVD